MESLVDSVKVALVSSIVIIVGIVAKESSDNKKKLRIILFVKNFCFNQNLTTEKQF